MRKALLIAVVVWLATCAGLWWKIATHAESAALTYAAAVFSDRIESHLAFQEDVRWDVFWIVWRYVWIMPTIVATVAALVWRDRSNAVFKVVVVFLAVVTTVTLLMGAWSAWVVDQFFIYTFQLLR